MADDLLPYYQRELTYIRRLAEGFAQQHSQEANRLGIRPGSIDDPHVERLIEAFAYLTARVRRKLDDEFPELTDGLLNVLFPHYLAPLPSASIVQFVLDESQGELSTGYRVKRGESLEISTTSGVNCTYRTCYETVLWPIGVQVGELKRRPFAAPETGDSLDAVALIHLRLACRSPAMKFGMFDPADFRSLRFFLQADDHHAMPLYELLMNHVVQVVVASSPSDAAAVTLPPEALQPVGFEAHQSLYPTPPRSFPGYGLLTEYFAFPWKFLFFDLQGLHTYPRASDTNRIDVFIYLDREMSELEKYVKPETFRLGCTPIVNLYGRRAEPIRLRTNVSEHPVIPDVRAPLSHEVYSIDQVRTTTGRENPIVYAPLYGRGSSDQSVGNNETFWASHRRQARDVAGHAIKGTDVFLSLVNRQLEQVTAQNADETLIVELSCFNRDLPNDLKGPRAHLSSGGPFRSIDIWKGPTRTIRPEPRRRGLWSLISHLTLNQLSLGDVIDETGQADGGGAAALRGILELYDFQGSKSDRQKIRGISSVHSRPVVDRLPGSPTGFARYRGHDRFR